jgi:hypothetical protein
MTNSHSYNERRIINNEKSGSKLIERPERDSTYNHIRSP